MANEKYLSQIKLNDALYLIKDKAAQAELAKLKTAAYQDYCAAITGSNDLPTDLAVKNYVDSQIATINKFDVVVDKEGSSILGPSVPASADTMYKLYLVPDADSTQHSAYIEYITIRSGEEGAYTYAWEAIGDTVVDLTNYYTKLEADLKFVTQVTEIAGVAITGGITKDALQNALDLKALAYKASASGSYTPEGSVSYNTYESGAIDDGATATGTQYIPANQLVKSVSQGKINIGAGDIEVTATKDNNGTFQPSGTIAAPTITVTPALGSVKEMKTAGTAYSLTDGSVVKGNDTKNAFATEGIMGHMAAGAEIAGDVDEETLIFVAAGTADAVTASADVTYTKPVLSGELPTFGDATVATGIESASSTAPVFTGDKFNLANGAAEEFTTTGIALSNGTDADSPAQFELAGTVSGTVTNTAGLGMGWFTGTAATITVQ